MVSSEENDDLAIDDIEGEEKSGPGFVNVMLDKLKIGKKKESEAGESEDPEKPVEKPVDKPKFKKKWVIIGSALLFVVLASSVTAYFFLTKDSVESLEDELKKTKGSAGKPLILGFSNILPLEKFSVELPGSEEKQILSMKIHIEFTTPEILDELLDRTFELRESIQNTIKAKRMNDIRNINGKILLKNEIISVLNGILESGKIRNIYITKFIVM